MNQKDFEQNDDIHQFELQNTTSGQKQYDQESKNFENEQIQKNKPSNNVPFLQEYIKYETTLKSIEQRTDRDINSQINDITVKKGFKLIPNQNKLQGGVIEIGDNHCDINQQQQQQQQQDQQQQSQENQNIARLFENKQSIVDFMLDQKLNQFIITKQNVREEEQFEKEYKILQKLKGQNITFDLTSEMNDSGTFQQIAGKIDLFKINQRIQNKTIFEIFYFILLEKLNKMHELGIAHSDIKPQNIVVSFLNEPFFIDFGASIYLEDKNDLRNYLLYRTKQFNVQDIDRTFDNVEDIKLYDLTQLSLTFLFLFCENEYYRKLFRNKDYNTLIQNLIDDNNKSEINDKINRKIVLSHISRIINKADSSINAIDEIQGQTYLIGKNQTVNSDDIFLENGKYKVKRIHKFSILLIYFLKQQGCHLDIDPQNVYIIPLPNMKEYLFISKAYRLDKYFEELLNGRIDLDSLNVYNIYEYIKAYKLKEFTAKFRLYQEQDLLFEKIKDLDFLEQVNLTVENIYKSLERIVLSIKQLSNFHVKNIEVFDNKINFKLIKTKDISKQDETKDESNQDASLGFYLSNVNPEFIKTLVTFKQYFNIGQIDISYKFLYSYVENEYQEQIFHKDIKVLLEQMSLEYQYPINIVAQKSFNIKEIFKGQDEKYKLDNLIQQNNRLYNCPSHKLTQEENQQKEKAFNQQQQFDVSCLTCQQMNQNIKQTLYWQIDAFTYTILQLKQLNKKIQIKIYDYQFEKLYFWLEIQNIIESNNNFNIEIILINCSFSKQISLLLKKMRSNYKDKVKYEFKNEQNQQYDNDYDYLKYQLRIECNQQLQNQKEQQLNIIFCNQNIMKEPQKIQDQQDNIQIKDDQESNKNIQQTEQENADDNVTQNEIQKIFKQNQLIYVPEMKDLTIQYSDQTDIQKFSYKNKHIETENINDIDFLTKEIENKNHYYQISVGQYSQSASYFQYSNFESDKVINFASDNVGILNKCYQLYLAIYNNYNQFQIHNHINIQPQDLYIIKQKMDYANFSLEEKVEFSKTLHEQYILTFLNVNIRKDIGYQHQQYRIYIDKNKNQSNSVDEQSQEFNINELQVNLKKFKSNSLLNSQLFQKISQNNLLHIQLVFQDKDFNKDKYLQSLIEVFEQNFKQNKMYSFSGSFPKEQILHKIFETIKVQENKIYFDLTKSKDRYQVPYSEFKQFIKMVKSDSLVHQFIFQIKIICNQIQNNYQEDFSDFIEIAQDEEEYSFIIFKEHQQNQQKQTKIMKMLLKYEESENPNIEKESDDQNSEDNNKDDYISFMQLIAQHQIPNHAAYDENYDYKNDQKLIEDIKTQNTLDPIYNETLNIITSQINQDDNLNSIKEQYLNFEQVKNYIQ